MEKHEWQHKSAERFSSTRSLTCVIRKLDAKQDHDFGCCGCRSGGGPRGIGRAIMRPRQHAKSKGLPTALLCEHDVLCHIAEKY
jgi:hypothetical protein